jgi:hypothetical protein
MRLRAVIATLLVLFCLRADAQGETPVDLQLILAVDASGSVNHARFELQKQGYAAAFRTQAVLNAIRTGPSQSIAVTMVQWTGYRMQVHVVPWTVIKDEASANAFADAIMAAPRQLFGGGTSISGAIDYGVSLMPASPYRGLRRVIDVSGDGSNNTGRPVTMARDEAVKAGIVINGLPIVSIEPYLDRYYFDNVIGGPGSFMIGADSYETFAGAIQRKLVLEIATEPGRQFAARED